MKNIIDLFSSNNQRYEKKYVISSLNENKFIFYLNKHPLFFKKIYEDRFINNIYFDTSSMNCYWDNVIGLSKRMKVRIRWYGKTYGYIKNPVLEFKIRNNGLGEKISFKLNDINIDSEFTIDIIHKQFDQLNISYPVKKFLLSLRMTLMNGYSRQYYISNNDQYRLTYDTNLKFLIIHNFNNNFVNIIKPTNHRVMEVKYDEHLNDNASQISNHFPFRITKSSKYVYGIDKLKL
ncbi:VTC domain-containing protein [Alphaproteobacteria bacterium]|nr:VTC domain-containing protein [Alphaproteobacteria bacterium]